MEAGGLLKPLYGFDLPVSRTEYWYDDGTLLDSDVFVGGRRIVRANIPIHNGVSFIMYFILFIKIYVICI